MDLPDVRRDEDEPRPLTVDAVGHLTRREQHVLALAAQGLTSLETGRMLSTSVETVKSQRKRVIAKLGAKTMIHAVAIALAATRSADQPLGLETAAASARRYVERCRRAGDHRPSLELLRDLVSPADAQRLWIAAGRP